MSLSGPCSLFRALVLTVAAIPEAGGGHHQAGEGVLWSLVGTPEAAGEEQQDQPAPAVGEEQLRSGVEDSSPRLKPLR